MPELALLNVGTGDTKISFDSEDPESVAHASLIVKDMLRKGYAILVEVGKDDKGPIYRRAKDFDPSTQEYIVAGLPPVDAPQEETPEDVAEKLAGSGTGKPRAKRGPYSRKGTGRATSRVSARTNKAVGVAPTAGG